MDFIERLKDLKIIVRTIMLGSVQLSMGRAKTETKTKTKNQHQNQKHSRRASHTIPHN